MKAQRSLTSYRHTDIPPERLIVGRWYAAVPRYLKQQTPSLVRFIGLDSGGDPEFVFHEINPNLVFAVVASDYRFESLLRLVK